DAQVPVLAGRFRVLRYEQRGHGGTAPPGPGPYTVADLGGDVVTLLDHLGVARASFCGVSLGGMVGVWLAAHRPERIERLVLACTAARLPPAEGWRERAAHVRRSGTSPQVQGALGRWFTPGFGDRRPETARAVAAMLAGADPEGYAGCCEAIAAMDQRADLARVVAPTLVLAGAEDPVTPPALGLELHQGVAGSALVVVPGAAHLVNVEQPRPFNEAVVAHLAGTAEERGRRLRTEVLGPPHVARSEAEPSGFAAPFVDLATRYAWGDIWSRPGLDRATRSCITLALLAGLGRTEELALHVGGALANGLTRDQIAEVLLQVGIYAGLPAANTAFAVARDVLDREDHG
ncbi:MAG: alpha/beta fold hydrolase, partial [Acidimicrobiales bacterium]